MKNILLLVHDDCGQEARLQAALDICRALSGHLTCLDICIMPALAGDYYSPVADTILLQEERDREAANRTRLEARLSREDVAWNWIDVTGNLAPAVTEAAGMADLIVMNRQLDALPIPDMRRATAEVLVKSGKPIVAVPDNVKGFNVAGRALIAWDGSPAAMAALRAAVPLLQIAGDVALLEVDDGSVDTPAEEAAAYLSRHGIEPVVYRETRKGESSATVILDRCREGGVDYVVMGGFGHRRFVEALFGGVTRHMLTDSPVPLFLAH